MDSIVMCRTVIADLIRNPEGRWPGWSVIHNHHRHSREGGNPQGRADPPRRLGYGSG